MAAEVLDRPPISLAELVGETAWPDGVEVGFVETAGGVRSPLAEDGDAVDLAAALHTDLVLVVADAGLGVINAVRTTVGALGARPPVLVVLNRFDARDDLQVRNVRWLRERDGLDVETDVAAVAAAVDERWRAKVGT
jgi:dethiobiotin synthetase